MRDNCIKILKKKKRRRRRRRGLRTEAQDYSYQLRRMILFLLSIYTASPHSPSLQTLSVFLLPTLPCNVL
jgi:hypothetical protein